jgi:hypothetical protein
VVVVCLAGFLFTPALEAQTNTGVIVGTVSDPTGAVIPGATVTITHSEVRAATEVQTNAVGNYVSTLLRAGPYEIRVEAPGFQTALRRDVVVHVNDRLQINFTLQPGAVAEVVEVTGAAPLLATQSGDVSSVVDSRTMVDLPLDGRRYIDLMLLAPGVVLAEGGEGDNPREGRFAVNGNQTMQNYYVLNGVDNNSFTQNAQDASPQAARPAPDALREFKIQTRTYSAEFGWAMGGVVNAEVKSGSNDLHGSVWLFNRNEKFNATSFFLNSAGQEKPEENRNQWGFAVGGPIWRDHTFAFFDLDNSHWGKGSSAFGSVPTALERVGDFSANPIGFDAASLANFVTAIPEELPCLILDDPVNPTQLLGLNLAANRTDGRPCGDPVGLALIDLYPLPTGPQPRDFFGAPSVPEDQWSFDLRIDQTLGDKDNIYGVYDRFDVVRVIERGAFENVLSPGSFSANSKVRTHVFSLAWVHTFSPTVVNDARLGTNYVFSVSEPLAPRGNAAPDFGFTGVPDVFAFGLPPITVSGFEIIGTNRWRPQDTRSQVWQFIDNLSYFRGDHSFKFGFEFKRAINNFLDIRAPNGETTIPNFWTGLGVANLLLGNASGARITSPLVPHNYIDGTMFYAQDSWRVTPTFTLNYGVRYEYFTPIIERDGLTSNLDPDANGGRGALITTFPGPLPATPGCSDPAGNPTMTNNPTGTSFTCLIQGPSGDSIFARTLVNPDRNNIAPRLSVAWQIKDRIVFRGGYAIFYQVHDRIGSGAILQLNPPQQFELSDSATSGQPPEFLLRDGFPLSAVLPSDIDILWGLAGGLRGRDMNEKSPYSHQWSVGPQIELTPDLALEVSYVGQNAKDLRRQQNIGQGTLATPGDRSSVVWPFPDWRPGRFGSGFLRSNGRSNYHSLQVNLRKRFSATPAGGLAFNAAYTWSKALGNTSGYLTGGSGSSQGGIPMNINDLDGDYGRLTFDQRQRFVLNWQWELPFGPGQTYLNQGLAAKLLGDWQVNGIWASTTGTPIGIGASDQTGTRGGTARADCIGDPLSGINRTVDQFFNPTAFRVPGDGFFGNCGVDQFSSWSRHNADMSIFKKFRIDEDRRFELRFEFFNIFNTPQFRPPSSSCSGLAGQACDPSGFGRTTSTKRAFVGDARVIQVGAKFYF